MVMKSYNNAQRGHVAVVRRVVNDREIVVDHANWLNGGEISLDNPVMDVSEDNDWSEVRVWYAPTASMGSAHWPVQGFIYPGKPRGGEVRLAASADTRRSADPIAAIIKREMRW